MSGSAIIMPSRFSPQTGGVRLAEHQLSLIPLRVRSRLPREPVGHDVEFRGFVEDGRLFYCKGDEAHRRVRATEWICAELARHLGIAVAQHAVIEDDGQTYFGSLRNPSTADEIGMKSFLATRQKSELGQSDYPGRYLYSLHALDLLVNNRDRYPTNFVLVPQGLGYQLQAIDFASASLTDFGNDQFPRPSDTTLRIGKIQRMFHGGHIDAAFEMIDRVKAIPMDVIDRILQSVTVGWLSDDEKRMVRGGWSDLENGVRLPALRAGLKNGSLA